MNAALSRWTSQASLVALAALTGAMLVIGLVLVPLWQSMPPQEYVAWFHANAPAIGGLMIPFGGLALALSVLAFVLALPAERGVRMALAVAMVAAAGLALLYPLYFAAANDALGTLGALGDADVSAELATWRRVHWARIGLSTIAVAATTLALRR